MHTLSKKQATKVTTALNTISIFLCLWTFFPFLTSNVPPTPLIIAIIIAAFPWVTLAAANYHRELFFFNAGRKDLQASYFMPIICLPLALLDIGTNRPEIVLILACLISSILCLVTYKTVGLPMIKPKKKSILIIQFVLMMLFGMFYGYGAIVLLNTSLDFSPIKVGKTQLVNKHLSRGGYRSTPLPQLVIAPWGNHKDNSTVTVNAELYKNAVVGSDICIINHRGALEIPWHTFSICLNP